VDQSIVKGPYEINQKETHATFVSMIHHTGTIQVGEVIGQIGKSLVFAENTISPYLASKTSATPEGGA